MTFESDIEEKPIEEYTEKEAKKMFVELFFWVVENKFDWLEECIAIKKANLLSEGMKE